MQTYRRDMWTQRGERKGETNWERSIKIGTIPRVKQIASGRLLPRAGSSAPHSDDLEGWEGGLRRRRYVYLRLIQCYFGRKQQNSVKQLSFN